MVTGELKARCTRECRCTICVEKRNFMESLLFPQPFYTQNVHLHSGRHRAFSSPVTMELTKSAKSSAFFKAIFYQSFSRLFFNSIIYQSFSGLHFPYVSFLEKRPGFKFTRYHGTDDWSSSSQVIPLDKKVSLQPGFKPSILGLA